MDKSRKCDVCEREFKCFATLEIHKRIHTGEKPFKCIFCEKGFSVQSNLRRHIRIHTGEKPFKCSICDRRFADSSLIKDHEMRHSGRNEFCKLCGKSFVTKRSLARHALYNHDQALFTYRCSVCNKTFSDLEITRIHLKEHPEEEKYIYV